MNNLHALAKDQWPSEAEVLRAVAKHGEIVICQYWDKGAKDYRRVYTQDYGRFMKWAPDTLGNHSAARICLVLTAAPLRFVYLVRSGGKMHCAGPQPWAVTDFAELATMTLHKAKKDHSTATLANQAFKAAGQDFRDYDENEFKRRFGGAMAGFRDERNPRRPHFLRWWIDERGAPDDKREAFIYELPKPLTLKQIEQFRESSK